MEGYNNEEESMRGQAEIMKYSFSYIESMVVNCAVELRIPDIIHSHGGPMTLAHIVAQISDAPSPNTAWLARIMNLLVRCGIFASHGGAGQDELFGLTYSSRWLLRDPPPGVPTLAPFVLALCHAYFVSPTHFLGACVVKSGKNPFERAHGKPVWESLAEDSKWNVLFNEGMACSSEIVLKAIVAEYGREVFGGLRSIVDVGGGTGTATNEIVKSYPNIEGINFDLPHVIATAPVYPRVSHVAGDAFVSIPNANAVLMKWFLQIWSDEECVKILKNCHKALPKEHGKVIIVDVVFEPRGKSLFDDTGVMLDITLGVATNGRARSESEWKMVLEEAGFSNCKFTKTTTFASIVEACPH